jgi:hypothetical protein
MRQCKYQVWNCATKTQEEKCGMWHKWSSDYEEFENGGCTFAVGVVENADGSVALPRADWVTFTDQPPTTGGAVANGEQQANTAICPECNGHPYRNGIGGELETCGLCHGTGKQQ